MALILRITADVESEDETMVCRVAVSFSKVPRLRIQDLQTPGGVFMPFVHANSLPCERRTAMMFEY